MAKEQGKWTRNPDDQIYGSELLLPSFGIRVTRSDPRSEAYPTHLGPHDFSPDSGVAFSISYLYRKGEATTADREFIGLESGGCCLRA